MNDQAHRADDDSPDAGVLGMPAGATVSDAVHHAIRIYQIELEMQNEELRRAQAELEVSRALYFNLYDTAPLGFCTVGPDGLVRQVNRATAAMLNLPVRDIIGKPFINFIFMDDLPVHHGLGKALADSVETHSCELRLKVYSGGPLWVELNAARRSSALSETEVQLAIADIQLRKSLEEQFRQSQKMEAFGQMAGGIAHDFNNIIAMILMQAELMEMKLAPEDENVAGLRHIRSDAMRAADLTKQLLLFSRKQVPHFREVDLNDVVSSLMRMSERIVGDHVRMNRRLSPGPLAVLADPGMLDQVMMNLVGNSMDSMPEGGEITVRTSFVILTDADVVGFPDGRPGNFVVLSIEDSGCGMAESVLSRIFEPFFTTKDIGKGTGLGLATVYGIVKQHKGFLSVESDRGVGTRFRIFLPAVGGAPSRLDAELPEYPQLRGTETILLVEDEPSLRRVTGMILEHFGYVLLSAGNGEEARDVWNEHPGKIDLLLTDIQMPGRMSGLELAHLLSSENPDLAVILISGGVFDRDEGHIRMNDAWRFIRKPVGTENLLETIHQCLSGVRGGQEKAASQ